MLKILRKTQQDLLNCKLIGDKGVVKALFGVPFVKDFVSSTIRLGQVRKMKNDGSSTEDDKSLDEDDQEDIDDHENVHVFRLMEFGAATELLKSQRMW